MRNFADQVRRAKLEKTDPLRHAIDEDDVDYLVGYVRNDNFNDFALRAYSSKNGYAIRRNPVTGDTEMFIAGSRSGGDWASNLLEGINTGLLTDGLTGIELPELDPFGRKWQRGMNWRRDAARRYDEIAQRNGVDVTYGHSRGGAIIGDMKYGGRKVGLDSAQIISDDPSNLNLEDGRWFDAILGMRGEHNLYADGDSQLHFVYKKT